VTRRNRTAEFLKVQAGVDQLAVPPQWAGRLR